MCSRVHGGRGKGAQPRPKKVGGQGQVPADIQDIAPQYGEGAEGLSKDLVIWGISPARAHGVILVAAWLLQL